MPSGKQYQEKTTSTIIKALESGRPAWEDEDVPLYCPWRDETLYEDVDDYDNDDCLRPVPELEYKDVFPDIIESLRKKRTIVSSRHLGLVVSQLELIMNILS